MTTKWTELLMKKVRKLQKEDEWHIEFDNSIIPKGQVPDWKQYMTRAFAWFECSECERKWPSSRVMVVFHMRLWREERKGTVKVRQFGQACKICDFALMERPDFTEENLDILMDKLMVKILSKCYGEGTGEVHRPFIEDEVKSPHEPDHCEACQLGICERRTSSAYGL